MKAEDANSFMADGQETFLDALDKEEAEILAPLEKELEETQDPVLQQGLKERINALRKEYARKRKDSDSSLFFSH